MSFLILLVITGLVFIISSALLQTKTLNGFVLLSVTILFIASIVSVLFLFETFVTFLLADYDFQETTQVQFVRDIACIEVDDKLINLNEKMGKNFTEGETVSIFKKPTKVHGLKFLSLYDFRR